jgi:hypothetical protein
MATTQNIIYLDLLSGIVKSCHHAIFDDRRGLVPTTLPSPGRPTLLYDLGLEAESDFSSLHGPLVPTPVGTIEQQVKVACPSTTKNNKAYGAWPTFPPLALYAPLPLRVTDIPHTFAAKATRVKTGPHQPTGKALTAEVVSEFLIGPHDLEMIYMSSDPYGRSFEASIDLRKCDLASHPTAGLQFLEKKSD